MKYILEKDGKDYEVDIPDGMVIRSEPLSVSNGEANIQLLRVSILGEGGLQAEFVNVGSFYPETMKPMKKTWVTG